MCHFGKHKLLIAITPPSPPPLPSPPPPLLTGMCIDLETFWVVFPSHVNKVNIVVYLKSLATFLWELGARIR